MYLIFLNSHLSICLNLLSSIFLYHQNSEVIMSKQIRFLISLSAAMATLSMFMGGSLLPRATAQSSQTSFEGRGVANGSAFTRGRNANAALAIDGSDFSFELSEPPGIRARVQYRGAIIRQNSDSSNSGSFTLDGRIRSFGSSENRRMLNATTGTCRIEVFDSRVVSSTCNSVASNSSTRFLGLEQF
jgi:hypothetical protein